MAGTRRSARPEDAGERVAAAADRTLADFAGQRLAVALSGGRDSVALLHALVGAAPRHGVALLAIHVHHGLSPHADAWSMACTRLTQSLHVPLDVRQVTVADAATMGVEAAAREARYAALRARALQAGAAAIALAHHEDDQAETLLLQALRGAGPHGLAAMPALVRDADALAWVRPLLDVPRSAIEAYVGAHALAYVDDDSNASARHRRNALRLDVMPALVRAFPAARHTLARAATHQAEAARLLDALAALDADEALQEGTLDRAVLARLPAERARNLLRWFLRGHGAPAPSSARLAAMLAQLTAARRDAQVELAHAGIALGIHRGRIHVHAPAPSTYDVRWNGEAEVALPHGRLVFHRTGDGGLDARRIAAHAVTIGSRRGGERLALDARRPRRTLAAWLYDAALPHWERDALPLVYCDGELAAVPSLGVDLAWRNAPGEPGWRLEWRPHAPHPRQAR